MIGFITVPNLHICTNDPLGATLVIRLPLLQIEGFPKSISVAAGACELIQLPSTLAVASSLERNKGIHIRSTNGAKLSVHVDFLPFPALPCIQFSSTSYKYFAFSSDVMLGGTKILLVPCEDSLEISYALKGQTQIHVPSLLQYQTFLIQREGDLTGTIIASSGPLAVFSSYNNFVGKNLYLGLEQIPPHIVYGQIFFALPFAVRHSGDIFRVGSVTDNNVINVTCTRRTASGSSMNSTSVTINTGHYYEFKTFSIQDEPGMRVNNYRWEFCCIETSKPAIVMQYILANRFDNITLKNARMDIKLTMSLVPPVTQYNNDYLFQLLLYSDYTAIPFISYAIAAKFFNASNNDKINFMVNRTTSFPVSECNNGSGGYIPIHCSNNEVCGYGAFTPIPAGTTSISYISPSDSNAALFVLAYGYHGRIPYDDGGYDELFFPLTAGYELEPIGRKLIMYNTVGVSA